MITKMNCKISKTLMNEFVISSPIGDLEIECCSIGLHGFKFKNFVNSSESSISKVTLKLIKHSNLNYESIKECLAYFETYFNLNQVDKSMLIDPSICWSSFCDNNSFREIVLKTLVSKVLIGQRVSYKELSSLAGRPNAQRAVGTVMGKNPIPFIIPCHRVVKSSNSKNQDQNIGNYGCGIEIKRWLLNYESLFQNKK
jgi:methylated-DNA-[protein]-cysteine S-methyltransferase